MAKAIFLVLVITLAFAAAEVDDICPDASSIAPCTCDREGANCMGKVSLSHIQKVFSTGFKYGAVRGIWLQETPIESIPANLIGQLKVQEVYVEIGNVTTVDLKFLDGAVQTLSVLSLFGNKIREIDFASFGRFPGLTTLNLGRNELTSIPDNGFASHVLTTLVLAQNKITRIGEKAFSRMPNLERLELIQNHLKTLGPYSMSISSSEAVINLAMNQISEVSATAFSGSTPKIILLTQNKLQRLDYDAFGPMLGRMGSRNGKLVILENPLTCSGCDDYNWLVRNKYSLSKIIIGFICPNGKTLSRLTMSDVGCRL